MKKLLISAFAVSFAFQLAADSWSRGDAEALLKTWCDALVKYQVGGMGDAALDGGMLCPACCFEHGRAADSVYALVYEWKRTGERKYLDAAERVLDWTERNMVSYDGANYNDVKHYWRGITVFSQISLGKTMLLCGDALPASFREKAMKSFRRQTEYIVRWLAPDGRVELGTANINYAVAFCEAMAIAHRVLGDESYLEKARAMVALLEPYFTEDGLLQGEGHPQNGVTPRGCKAVDIGYNFEESIPSLWHYAELVGDKSLEKKLMKLTAGHLEFVLPDGGLDNSMGSRSCKWTYWGSRTSDGILPALAHYAKHGGKGAVRAIDRHLKLLAKCTSDTGLLYGGLYYREADEPPCIHHTFAHVKALVDLLLAAPPEKSADEPLPREVEYGRRTFPDFATELVAVGPWRASFSANDNYSNKGPVNVGGGSPTMLWHRDVGVVAAATMFSYYYAEHSNFQDQRRHIGVETLTPRIESGKTSNVMDVDVKTDVSIGPSSFGTRFAYSARGVLTDKDGAKGVPFEVDYRLDGEGLFVRAKAEGKFRYVFPVVATDKDEVVVEGRRAFVKRPGGTVVLVADRDIKLVETQRGRRAFNPIAGLMCAVFCVESDGAPVVLEVSAQR